MFLDHNATTPLDPRVLQTMLPWLEGVHGNPSSIHQPGRAARAALDAARGQVAALVGAQPSQVIFTGGGTEADNLVLKGVCSGEPQGCLLVSRVEHAAILGPAKALAQAGWTVRELPVDPAGRVLLDALHDALQNAVRLVCVMLANNETGVIQDLQAVSDCTRRQGVLLHTDAIQAAGKIPVDFPSLGANFLTLSAHKINGPLGVGALVIDKRADIQPLVDGGGQERGLRGGTENLPGIIGFGKAAELAVVELRENSRRLRRLRDTLESGLKRIRGVQIFAEQAERLPNTVQIAVAGFDGEMVVMELDRRDIAVSSGSACHSGSGQPSHVLVAMGVDEASARGAVRISLGQGNTAEDIGGLLAALTEITTQRTGAAALV